MAVPIIPRLVRGRLYFEIGSVLSPAFAQYATTWSAAQAHGLDIVDVGAGNSAPAKVGTL